jgi:hypothetical protein
LLAQLRVRFVVLAGAEPETPFESSQQKIGLIPSGRHRGAGVDTAVNEAVPVDDPDRLRNTGHVLPEERPRLPTAEILQPVVGPRPCDPSGERLSGLTEQDVRVRRLRRAQIRRRLRLRTDLAHGGKKRTGKERSKLEALVRRARE